MLPGPQIGNTFSTISNCLDCLTDQPVTALPSTSSSSESHSVKEQLAQIDGALNESMQSSFAFNAPEST